MYDSVSPQTNNSGQPAANTEQQHNEQQQQTERERERDRTVGPNTQKVKTEKLT